MFISSEDEVGEGCQVKHAAVPLLCLFMECRCGVVVGPNFSSMSSACPVLFLLQTDANCSEVIWVVFSLRSLSLTVEKEKLGRMNR